MALAGHPVVLSAKNVVTAVISGDEVDGIKSVDYSPSVDQLDITDFKDTTGAKIRLAGLSDGSVKISGDLELSDAPQALLRSSMASGAKVWITLSFNPTGSTGSKGFQVECKVSTFSISTSHDGLITFSCDLTFDGAPVTY